MRAIRPGLPLFLYNYSTHQLHGIFEVTTPSNSICFLIRRSISKFRRTSSCSSSHRSIRPRASAGRTSTRRRGRTRSAPASRASPRRYLSYPPGLPSLLRWVSLARVSVAMADDHRSAQHQTDKTKARDPSTCFDVHKGPGPTTGMAKKDFW